MYGMASLVLGTDSCQFGWMVGLSFSVPPGLISLSRFFGLLNATMGALGTASLSLSDA